MVSLWLDKIPSKIVRVLASQALGCGRKLDMLSTEAAWCLMYARSTFLAQPLHTCMQTWLPLSQVHEVPSATNFWGACVPGKSDRVPQRQSPGVQPRSSQVVGRPDGREQQLPCGQQHGHRAQYAKALHHWQLWVGLPTPSESSCPEKDSLRFEDFNQMLSQAHRWCC